VPTKKSRASFKAASASSNRPFANTALKASSRVV
jgi:hypothetical protein